MSFITPVVTQWNYIYILTEWLNCSKNIKPSISDGYLIDRTHLRFYNSHYSYLIKVFLGSALLFCIRGPWPYIHPLIIVQLFQRRMITAKTKIRDQWLLSVHASELNRYNWPPLQNDAMHYISICSVSW